MSLRFRRCWLWSDWRVSKRPVPTEPGPDFAEGQTDGRHLMPGPEWLRLSLPAQVGQCEPGTEGGQLLAAKVGSRNFALNGTLVLVRATHSDCKPPPFLDSW